ncbi:MAG: hypothetical protein IJT41_11650 [Clostridia bacterium]|nr:hypothetical protein [Clostridia bacterium]
MTDKYGSRLYELIPSQKTMVYMLKYSLHKQVINVPTSFAIAKKLDFALLQRAFEQEVRRNDCLRIVLYKTRQGIFQSFPAEKALLPVPVLHFDSLAAQEAHFNADASRPLRIFRGETFRIAFFTDADGKCGVYLNASHLIMDAVATSVFYRDLMAVYDALAQGAPMPQPPASFEAYLESEYAYLRSAKYEKDRAFLTEFHRSMGGAPFYAGVHGPEMLERQRKLFHNPDLGVPIAFDPFRDRAQTYRTESDEATTRLILDYCAATGVSPEVLLQTGYKLHAARINGRAEDTMLMALCGRRVTDETKNMGGCLTQPIQMRTKMPQDATFRETVCAASNLRMRLYRHSSFPYLDALELERKMYHFNRAQGPALMMYTWLPVEQLGTYFDEEIEYRGYALDRYIMPLYTFTFKIPNREQIRFYYLYRTNTISMRQIHALHEGCLQALRLGIANPDMTLREIYDALE